MTGVALWRQNLILPLRPATTVHEGTILLDPVRGRHHEHLRLHRARVHARRVPEFRTRGGERIHHHQPFEVAQRLHHTVRIGADAGGGHSAQDQAFHLSLERLVVDRHPGCVLCRLGDEVEGKLVLLGGGIAIPSLEQADHEVLVVDAKEVPGARVAALGGARLHVGIEVELSGSRDAQVARQDFPGDGVVGIALDIGVAAFGIHAAARTPRSWSTAPARINSPPVVCCVSPTA